MAAGTGDAGDEDVPTQSPGPPGHPRRRWVWAGAVSVVIAAVVGVTLATRSSSDDADDPAVAADRLDVAIVGDSLIEQSRDQLLAHADAAGLSVEAVAFGGSAPCDWMADFERFAAERPRVLIISFAGNDSTPCVNPTGGGFRDPDTIARAYAEMMPGIVDLFADTGTDVYVALPPPVGEPASEPAAAAIRETYRDLAAGRDDVRLVDPAPLLGPDRRFHRTLPCETWEAARCSADGTLVLRHDDGIHLTPDGGERYARVLLAAIGHPVEG
jgi:lysophospholipase L1-like esterase